MLRASKTLTKPVLPYVPLSGAHEQLEGMEHLQSEISRNELFSRMPPDIIRIITRIHQYNEMLACYLAGSIDAPQMTILAELDPALHSLSPVVRRGQSGAGLYLLTV